MNKSILTLLALSTTLAAQTGTVPPGFDTTESTGSVAYSIFLGGYPDARFQVSNADLKGKGLKIMSEISFRQDGQVSTSRAVARSWSNVKLMMSDTTFSSLSRTWSNNFLSTPTLAFSGTHSWPALTSQPPGTPNPWDNGGLKFTFTSPFLYTGTADLLLDLTFTGGTLANNGAWGPKSSNANFYYLDGRSVITSSGGSLSSAGLAKSCVVDSSMSGTRGPNSYFWHWSFAKNTGSATTSDKMRFYFQLSSFPPNIGVFQAVTLAGTTSHSNPKYPVIAGLGCQNLMVDLTTMLNLNRFTTDANGRALTNTNNYIPFVSAAVGAHIYTQAAWSDTITGGSKLSRVSDTTIRPQPANADFQGKIAYNYVSTATTSFTPGQFYVPVYRHK